MIKAHLILSQTRLIFSRLTDFSSVLTENSGDSSDERISPAHCTSFDLPPLTRDSSDERISPPISGVVLNTDCTSVFVSLSPVIPAPISGGLRVLEVTTLLPPSRRPFFLRSATPPASRDYGFDFLGNITFDDFVQLVKYKTGMGRKGGISLHYEHPEMHFVIKMVDDSDFGRLKRVIRAVTTPLCIYIMEEEEVVYRRCIGEGSGSKRSSGRGSNNLTCINFAHTLPYYGNLPGYPIIHENLGIEPATYHQAPLDNFELGFDDTDTFLEPNNTNNNVENPEKIPFSK
ncbi:hypothetical protein LXL04_031151 [Taraxacum kok-saghyz]